MCDVKRAMCIALVTALCGGSVLLAGCTRHASDEEMRQLDDLKAEVSSLERQASQTQATKSSLEREVAEKNDKLKWCAGEKEVVAKRVQGWK